MKTLVLCHDLYHDAAIARAGLIALAEPRYAFEWLEDAGVAGWSPSRVREFPLVVLTKSNVRSPADRTPWLALDQQHLLRDHVQAGAGLVVIHSGTAGYRDRPVVRRLTGGAFIQHPPSCDVMLEPRADHPLVAGVDPFTVHDEHYFVELDDPEADVFLHARSSHGVQPAGWTRREGEGRVCVLTPGHHQSVWLHPSFQTILRRALAWAAPQS